MGNTITSRRNPRVKNAVQLRDRRDRDGQSRIIVDGARELECAILGGVDIVEVFVCPELFHTERCELAINAVSATSANVLTVSRDVFGRIAYGDRAEGIVGVAKTPTHSLGELSMGSNPLVLVLESVEKPGNVGAVIRSADGAGASAVIVADAPTDLYNPNIIRASLGTIFTLPVCEATSADAFAWLQSHDFRIYSALVDGQHLYTDQDYPGPTALLLGSETSGLSPIWNTDDVRSIRLPMCGTSDSLNVSAAAAVLMYEAHRQRSGNQNDE